MIRLGDTSFALPRIVTLDDDAAAAAYWDALGAAGMRCPYGVHPSRGPVEHHYGTAVEIDAALAQHLAGAVRAVDALVKRYVREAGGLTRWLDGRAPTFGGVPLNFAAANRPLERLFFDDGARGLLPLIVDPIVTRDGDAASLSVVELQSGLGYADIVFKQLAALGYDGDGAWCGAVHPRAALAAVRPGFAGGRDVSVLATFPSLSGNFADEAGWARFFAADGAARGFFLATDLARDGDGWYHLEYERDAATGLPLLDGNDRPLRRHPPRKRRITHVVAMQTQTELDHIHERLDGPARARFLDFVSDGESVEWLLPHAGWYVADKSLMARLAGDLARDGSPYAHLFVECRGPGETVAGPGEWVVKPIRGVGGKQIRYVSIGQNERIEVPDGCIAQRRFHPFAVPLRLPASLAAAFPVPDGKDARETLAAIELRVMSMPGSTESEDAFLYMSRIAPAFDPVSGAPVITNLGTIQTAIWNSPRVDEKNYRSVPFGWGVVAFARS